MIKLDCDWISIDMLPISDEKFAKACIESMLSEADSLNSFEIDGEKINNSQVREILQEYDFVSFEDRGFAGYWSYS